MKNNACSKLFCEGEALLERLAKARVYDHMGEPCGDELRAKLGSGHRRSFCNGLMYNKAIDSDYELAWLGRSVTCAKHAGFTAAAYSTTARDLQSLLKGNGCRLAGDVAILLVASII